nr:hypothetical protein [Stenotrophomonas maltophilia]
MTTDNKALAVDVLAVLRSQLSWIGPCRPDGDEIDCERWDRIELAISAVAELIAFAESFSFTVTDSFYKDAYLGINLPQGESHPHGKKIVYRLPTPSNMSPDMAEIERMRTSAIARIKGEAA